MILTVTLNAALDRTLRVPNFQLNLRHRSSSSLSLPGGKGVNIARALKRLGQPVIATGLAGGRTGTSIIEQLTAEGILNDFVRIHDESRTSTARHRPDQQPPDRDQRGRALGPGPAELAVLIDKLRYLSKGADVVVLAGSLPRDVPSEFYATVVRELRRHELVTALDAAGPPLRAGLAAEPSDREPQPARGRGDRRPRVPGRRRPGRGRPASLVAMGAGNALLHDEDGCVARLRDGKRTRTFRARLPRRIEVDQHGRARGTPSWPATSPAGTRRSRPETALRLAVACGAANTQTLGAGVFDPADVEAFARQVEVEALE